MKQENWFVLGILLHYGNKIIYQKNLFFPLETIQVTCTLIYREKAVHFNGGNCLKTNVWKIDKQRSTIQSNPNQHNDRWNENMLLKSYIYTKYLQ